MQTRTCRVYARSLRLLCATRDSDGPVRHEHAVSEALLRLLRDAQRTASARRVAERSLRAGLVYLVVVSSPEVAGGLRSPMLGLGLAVALLPLPFRSTFAPGPETGGQ